ncbi:DUF416 family protein [Flavobacterium ajazii]|uniref:DUF416 family protein n=1 Tax=Flavobacterium ajazii TaxID=2692318 RepID=UPI0013D77554|nr:DUF416 family protein [Flavobacterium ajazii]
MDEYRNIIRQKLDVLNGDKKLAFSLLICERLLPNYVFFSKKYNYGNPIELNNIILVLYKDLLEKNKGYNIDEYIDVVENITPDTEDYSTILVSFALDACTSILSTLYFLKDSDVENIIDVATYARDTVDMFIQERDDLNVNNSELELLIEQDSFMQIEKKRQVAVIDYLDNIDSVTQNDLEILRQIVKEDIIDLSLLQEE